MKRALIRFFAFLGVFVLLVSFFLLYKNISLSLTEGGDRNVSSFRECVMRGYIVMESFPRVCKTPSGDRFVEEISSTSNGITYTNASSSDIVVETPLPETSVEDSFTVTGKARGYWFFEGSFPIVIQDIEGKTITTVIAKAETDWMTEEFVSFTATVDIPQEQRGKVVVLLKKDNPSGLSEHDASISFSVTLSQKEETNATTTVSLFYHTKNVTTCDEKDIVAVTRDVVKTKTPIQDSVRLLLKGDITEDEKKKGIETSFPLKSFSLVSASLSNEGVLTLSFDDPLYQSSGGACKASLLAKQVEMTAKQFTDVKSVILLPEELFQP